ncbi:RICIN domain-containing protein, partial [Arenicella sp.]|nr:RICIN domain-containing protein [Arenicella sp.]
MKIINRMSAALMIAASLGVAQTVDAETVHMQKARTNFAIDGNRGSSGDREQVYLYNSNLNNVNQQWTEIDRGNGYYSYQKIGTTLCIDGGNGGERGQSVILWQCRDSNQNQHWRKVSIGASSYRLEKRNASSFSIDGKGGGENLQGLHLWSSNDGNVNQQWEFSNIGGTTSDCNRVDSLSELKDYLTQSNQCVEMAPGTYTFDSNNT